MTKPQTTSLARLAHVLHESRMKFCSIGEHNQPWPDKLPGDFGYVPQPWVDIAFAQAKSVMEWFNVTS